MKKTVKKKWLKALRSGEYKQGKWRLQNSATKDYDSSFCCLGVLCDLAVAEGVIPPPVLGGIDGDKLYYGADANRATNTTLPPEVVDWAFLKREVERGGVEKFSDPQIANARLSWWNDFGDRSFDGIANLIEEHL